MRGLKRILLAGAAGLTALSMTLATAGPGAAQDADAQAGADAVPALLAGDADGLDVLDDAATDHAVARASEWLNGVTGLQGRFLQINPDGSVADGQFHMLRPGRARFAYDPPSPLTIVADGRTVAQIDSALATVDRAAIDQTPLAWLLRADVDLASDANVRGAARQDGLLFIALEDPAGDIPGQIVLVFSGEDFSLREWAAIDEFGQETRVILSQVTRPAQIDPRLFVYDAEPAPARRPGRR